MYICLHCGLQFDDPVLTHNGGYYEEPWYECPYCGSDAFEETEQCEECDEWVNEKNLVNGLCAACIEKHANDYETVKAYGAARKECIEINGLFAWAFTTAEIEEILERELKNSGNAEKDAHRFATDDPDDFTMWLKKEEKKDE